MLDALRHYALSYRDSAQQLARWMDLPTTDGTALGEIMWAESEDRPLSPGRLSARIGLTSGATNALVNRLEEQGLVTRSRESEDRRVVALRATVAARDRAAPFLRSSEISLAAALSEYDDETLETVGTVLARFAAVLPGMSAQDRPPTPASHRTATLVPDDPG